MPSDHVHGVDGDDPRSRAAERAVRRLLLIVITPLALATIAGLVLLWPGQDPEVPPEVGPPATAVKADVEQATFRECPPEQGGGEATCQVATIRLRGGADTGLRTELVLNVVANPGIPTLSQGDKIVVQPGGPDPGSYAFVDYQRTRPLLLLGAVFSVLVVALARWKGLAALVGLLVTLVVLAKFVLPAILDGKDPLIVCIVGASVTMFVVFYLAHGVTVRSSTALVGTLLSLLVTGLLAMWATTASRLTGTGTEEALTLNALAGQVDLRGLLLGGIIIGGLGVLNDVTITQASTVWQLHLADPAASPARLYRQGMRVGRDHIGATVDTLILAYAGAALPLLIFFSLADRSAGEVITSSLVAEEVVRSLVGAIGLVLSVPITTGLAAIAAARAPVAADDPSPPPLDRAGSRARAAARDLLSKRKADPWADGR
ncbi:MAG: YibE/F family protein [Acidimicrobiales bacterium]